MKLQSSVRKNWQPVILCLSVAFYVILFSIFTVLRHNAFASNFDLANMDQTLWNTLNGRFFQLSTPQGTVSRLAIHADFILILLSPLYLLWDNVRILLIAQTVFLGIAAFPVYLLAQKILKNSSVSLIIALIYLLSPPLQWANLYDFHAITLAIPFLLFTFYFALGKRWGWYFLFFALAIITKEEVSLILATFAIYLFFLKEERKIGLASFLIGLLWFLLMVFVLIPRFGPSGQHWAFDVWFKEPKDGYLTGGPLATLLFLAKSFVSKEALFYYLEFLKSFSPLFILGFPWLVLSLPELAINLTSSYPTMRTISLHYQSGVIPGIIMALIFAFRYLKIIIQRLKPHWPAEKTNRFLFYLALLTLPVSFLVSYRTGPLPTNPDCWCAIYAVGSDEKEFEKLLKQIPVEASIAASGEIRPHLTHRENAFNLPFLPDDTDYIAIIDQERFVGNFEPRQEELRLIKKLKEGTDYFLVKNIGHFYLFKNAKLLK